ncbi:MAG: DUF3592 domain-containing protein [bacterium]|nr:DUF3592 domain-containing protein [bacterium]
MSKSEETVPLADPEHSTLGTVIVLGMMGLLTLLASAFVAFSVWWATEQASRIATWPSTTGTVLSSRVDAQRSSNPSPRATGSTVKRIPLVDRSYTVNGTEYTFDRVTPMENVSLGSRWASDIVARYRPSNTVQVYYNPADPGESFIEPVYDDTMFMIALGACAMPAFIALLTTLGGKDKYALKWKIPVIAGLILAIGGGVNAWSYFNTVPTDQWTRRAEITGIAGAGVVVLLVLTGVVFRIKHLRWRRRFA